MPTEMVEKACFQRYAPSECAELDNLDPVLSEAEKIVPADCHWSISPAWCYAIGLVRRLEEERLRCSNKDPSMRAHCHAGRNDRHLQRPEPRR